MVDYLVVTMVCETVVRSVYWWVELLEMYWVVLSVASTVAQKVDETVEPWVVSLVVCSV